MTYLWNKGWIKGLEGAEPEKVTLGRQKNQASVNLPLNRDQILTTRDKNILRRGNESKEKKENTRQYSELVNYSNYVKCKIYLLLKYIELLPCYFIFYHIPCFCYTTL